MKKKQMIWPSLAIVAIVIIVAVVIIIINFKGSSSDLTVDEEENLVGEAMASRNDRTDGKYCNRNVDCYGLSFDDDGNVNGKSICYNHNCELRTLDKNLPVTCLVDDLADTGDDDLDKCTNEAGRYYRCGKVYLQQNKFTFFKKPLLRCVEKESIPVDEGKRCIQDSECSLRFCRSDDCFPSSCYYGVCVLSDGGFRTCSGEECEPGDDDGYTCGRTYAPPYEDEGIKRCIEPN